MKEFVVKKSLIILMGHLAWNPLWKGIQRHIIYSIFPIAVRRTGQCKPMGQSGSKIHSIMSKYNGVLLSTYRSVVLVPY